MRLLPAGEAAILVELSQPEQVLPVTAGLRQAWLPAVTDLVPAERTVLVAFDPGLAGADEIARWIRATPPLAAQRSGAGPVELRVHYDGEDLPAVAALLGLTVEEVIAQHTGTDWTVAFSGFAPGFGYLRPPDGRLAVPRRDTSRPRVPAGSVALAAGYSGVYPRASPGGWQLIGRTDAVLWDAGRFDQAGQSPALLQPGGRVRFRPA